MINKLLPQLVCTPGFLNLDFEGKGFEVKPGRYSPIYINMKATWGYPAVHKEITKEVISKCQGVDTIIGIETGGSPYASAVAYELGCGLIVARKERKNGIGDFLTNELSGRDHDVVIFDDILATGNSLSQTISDVKEVAKSIKFVSVLSYGPDNEIARKHQIQVASIFNVEDLVPYVPEKEAKLFYKKLLEYKTKLIETVYK